MLYTRTNIDTFKFCIILYIRPNLDTFKFCIILYTRPNIDTFKFCIILYTRPNLDTFNFCISLNTRPNFRKSNTLRHLEVEAVREHFLKELVMLNPFLVSAKVKNAYFAWYREIFNIAYKILYKKEEAINTVFCYSLHRHSMPFCCFIAFLNCVRTCVRDLSGFVIPHPQRPCKNTGGGWCGGGNHHVHVSVCSCVSGLCPDYIFWTASTFVTRLGMAVCHHESVCRA